MIAHGDADGIVGLASLVRQARGGRRAADAEAVAGLDLVGLGDTDHVAGPGLLEALAGAALQREQRAGALRQPRSRRQFRAFGQGGAEHAGDGEATDRSLVAHLEHLDRRRVDTEPFGGLGGRGRIVPQRLEQAADAEAVDRRAEHHRHDQPLGRLALQVAEDERRVGLLVLEQLLEQVVVVVGELFEHVEAPGRLGVLHIIGNGLLLGGLALAVMVGAVEREVDEADYFLALGDRVSGGRRAPPS